MGLTRRALLAGSALAATACTPAGPLGPSPSPSRPGLPAPSPAPTATGTGPFPVATPSELRVVVHPGPLGTSVVDVVLDEFAELHEGLQIRTEQVLDLRATLGTHLQHTEADIVHNAGPQRIQLPEAADELANLGPLLNAPNLDGVPIRNTLYRGALRDGRVLGVQRAVQYALVAHGLWYDEGAFGVTGFDPPTTWDELLELGRAVTAEGRTLCSWDEECVEQFLEMTLSLAIKTGGHDVRRGFDNLRAEAWRHPAVVEAFESVAALAATEHLREETGAVSRWATGEGPVLLPAGATVVRQTKAIRRKDFQPAVAPLPLVSNTAALPQHAAHVQPQEAFLVPAAAANRPAGFEFLRMLFSPTVAAKFSALNEIPTVVRGSLEVGVSSAVTSQARLIAGSGQHAFSWRFLDYYGLTDAFRSGMTRLLRGEVAPKALLDELQELTDETRHNPGVVRFIAR